MWCSESIHLGSKIEGQEKELKQGWRAREKPNLMISLAYQRKKRRFHQRRAIRKYVNIFFIFYFFRTMSLKLENPRFLKKNPKLAGRKLQHPRNYRKNLVFLF
jgi:hypothetical protein